MNHRLPVILDSIIAKEGGYWDDPIGGPTNFGIRQKTLDELRKEYPEYPARVQELTEADARVIYEVRYILPNRILELPEALDVVMAHTVVLSWDDGVRELQKIVGSKPDGVLGPNTLFAVKRYLSDNDILPWTLSVYVAVAFVKVFSRHRYARSYSRRFSEVLVSESRSMVA